MNTHTSALSTLTTAHAPTHPEVQRNRRGQLHRAGSRLALAVGPLMFVVIETAGGRWGG